MADPLMTAIAATVVAKTVEGLSEAGRSALQALFRLVRGKLGNDPASREALARAESEPADEATTRALAEALRTAAADDPQFAEELGRLWHTVREGGPVVKWQPVSNTVSGGVSGNVVQANDIRGGVSFGRA